MRYEPFQGSNIFQSFTQGCRLRSNPGLKLANAFGVNPGLKLANACGVNPRLEFANACGVNPRLEFANACGVNPGGWNLPTPAALIRGWN